MSNVKCQVAEITATYLNENLRLSDRYVTAIHRNDCNTKTIYII